jgi:uncharacterized protein (DUF2147 family)
MKPLLFWLASLLAPTPSADPYLGTWLAEDQDGRIEIVRQGASYVGRFVGFKDVALAHRQGYDVGAVLLSNLHPAGDELAGQVMDYTTHKQYAVTLRAPDATHLLLKVTVMGLTAHAETWTRVAARP